MYLVNYSIERHQRHLGHYQGEGSLPLSEIETKRGKTSLLRGRKHQERIKSAECSAKILEKQITKINQVGF